MPDNNQVLLSTAYLPNVQYFSKILCSEGVTIEIQENFQKQSYRNRATILGANGPLDLIIPVVRPDGNRTCIRSVLIDYSMPWQRVHWKAILSAYKNSSFFDIFEQEFRPLYSRMDKYLIDFNLVTLDLLLEIAGIEKKYLITELFVEENDNSYHDYRNSIHPKKRLQRNDEQFEPYSYFQVFSNKFKFVPNLSFIDLIFNEGPQASTICRKCYK
jgi:hypothetical protein